ncbi:hypothetical protein KJ819_00880 [Patescibacteria group bacterium]|nr:hypothetical protein [Patescibacteria group bacterium]MBU1500709.1 hypothetical protein [Patescibacteria group bacterium]MBU2080973.1 hypothetical protein [Patescibacteria group bacterium]MBU2124241.1 hypothetical protein [Patescibacteria group bacterium]MBU2195034.1 hypothetical protein [Patescibacteria group bacterium]
MTWAQRRRFMIIGGAVAIGVLLLAGLIVSIVYETPSCTDQVQNQDEAGVDCGGSCARICTVQVDAPRISFARALQQADGRTDVIAYIENRNRGAVAKHARYSVELYNDAGLQIATREDTIDLPAQSIVPIFLPGVYAGSLPVAKAFVSFEEDIVWTKPKTELVIPTVSRAEFVQGFQPRINAELQNSSPYALFNVRVVATAFGADGNALAASQTVVREIPARGSASAVFTWNAPFGEPLRVEVLPIIPLP